MKIKTVETICIRPSESWLRENRIVNPMSIFPKYKYKRSSWYGPIDSTFVKITTDDGISGLGFVSGRCGAASFIIEKHFAKLLIGQDPFNVELLWEQMFRSSIAYGRKGLAIEAISGVDCALWDIIGKIKNEPVFRLLGGQTKDKILTYATGPEAKLYVDRGFKAVKIPMPYGPMDGERGVKRNEEFVKKTREQIGYDIKLMIDCYMGWDIDYTIRMAKILEKYDIAWIEEPLMPSDIEGYVQLSKKIGIPLACGEHEFTRYGFKRLIDSKAVRILQPDINRAGGITEVKKICALAAAEHLPVIPHAGGAYSYHLVMSQINCPMAECVIMRVDSELGKICSIFQETGIKGEPIPDNGYIRIPNKPGFGIELDPRVQIVEWK